MIIAIGIAVGLVWLLGLFWWFTLLGVFCRRRGCKIGRSVRVRIRETGQLFDMSYCSRCRQIKRAPVQL
jgi:hypothetical protein